MEEKKEQKKEKAWIIGNIISFKKPIYKSPFFGVEEVYVIRTKKEESPIDEKTVKSLNNLLK